MALDGSEVPTPVIGEVTLEDLAFGIHTIEVRGIAPNCRLTNHPASREITLFNEEEKRVDLVVLCLKPNPGRIFYTAAGGNVFFMSALGGDRVLLPIRSSVNIAISPVDGRIAFDAGVIGSDVWVADPDGANPVNLTNSPVPTENRPSWSPDGTRIAYRRQEIHENSTWDLYVMNADGSGVTNLTPDTPDWTDSEPAWSPDGSRIAFRSHRTGPGELFTIRPDGADLEQVTTNGNFDANPRWSPDGTEIVFTRFGSSDFDLYRIAADGSGLTRLTDDPARSSEPDWSPDGRWIVFASRPPGGVFDLFLMRTDGSDRIQLTFGERAGFPRWVP